VAEGGLDLFCDQSRDARVALDEGHGRVLGRDLLPEVLLGVGRHHSPEDDEVELPGIEQVEGAVELVGGSCGVALFPQDRHRLGQHALASPDHQDPGRTVRGGWADFDGQGEHDDAFSWVSNAGGSHWPARG
jgi:hypothetical protein